MTELTNLRNLELLVIGDVVNGVVEPLSQTTMVRIYNLSVIRLHLQGLG